MASESKEFAKMAEKMWGMLDTLAASDPDEYKKFVDQQLQEGKEHFSSPEGVYSLKCTNVHYKGNNHTLYINTSTWTRVPYPPTDNDPIPVKGGTLRHLVTKDNKKQKWPTQRDLVYDIAFNPRVLTECSSDASMQKMLINLSLDFTEDATGIIIDRDNVIKVNSIVGGKEDVSYSLDEQLQHLLPKGSEINDTLLERLSKLAKSENDKTTKELPSLKLPQEIKDIKKPLIEELPNTSNYKTLRQPPYQLTDTCDAITISVTLKGVTSAGDIDLEISETDITLTVNDRYNLSIQLGVHINEDTLKAQFNTRTSILSLVADKIKKERINL